MITQEILIKLLNYDESTGIFTRRITTSSRAQAGDVAGTIKQYKNDKYCVICVNKSHHKAHRLAWLYVHGYVPEGAIDHIDGDGTNNSIINLRLAFRNQNQANSKRRCDNRSGFKGVSFHKRAKKWVAQITDGQKNIYLGLYLSPEEAHRAYWNKARELFGEFARAA